MTDEQMDRREFMRRARNGLLKWTAAGALGGAAVGMASWEEPPAKDPKTPKRPDIRDKLPEALDDRTFKGHMTTRTALGGMIGMVGHTLIKRNSPPADTGRREREAGEHMKEGREWEKWHDEQMRNPNDTHRNP